MSPRRSSPFSPANSGARQKGLSHGGGRQQGLNTPEMLLAGGWISCWPVGDMLLTAGWVAGMGRQQGLNVPKMLLADVDLCHAKCVCVRVRARAYWAPTLMTKQTASSSDLCHMLVRPMLGVGRFDGLADAMNLIDRGHCDALQGPAAREADCLLL
eukprot:548035-Pelagomonas_calceolata.AAC.7